VAESSDVQELGDQTAPDGWVRRRPILLGALFGAVASLLLPIYATIWKISLCNYGWDADYSGICICVPPFMIFGGAIGALGGVLGKATGWLLEQKTMLKNPQRISSVVGGVLGSLLGLAAGAIPAFLFAFPDC
jgi:hypothetical protein